MDGKGRRRERGECRYCTCRFGVQCGVDDVFPHRRCVSVPVFTVCKSSLIIKYHRHSTNICHLLKYLQAVYSYCINCLSWCNCNHHCNALSSPAYPINWHLTVPDGDGYENFYCKYPFLRETVQILAVSYSFHLIYFILQIFMPERSLVYKYDSYTAPIVVFKFIFIKNILTVKIAFKFNSLVYIWPNCSHPPPPHE